MSFLLGPRPARIWETTEAESGLAHTWHTTLVSCFWQSISYPTLPQNLVVIMCVYDAYVHIHMHATAHVWKSEDNLVELFSVLPWVLVSKFRLPGCTACIFTCLDISLALGCFLTECPGPGTLSLERLHLGEECLKHSRHVSSGHRWYHVFLPTWLVFLKGIRRPRV